MSKSVAESPQIADREALVEFRDSLTDHASKLENLVARLRRDPRDNPTVAALFRNLHTIKGDASLCQFELGVKLVHPIESVLGRLREGELSFTPTLAEAILLAIDRLELAVAALLSNRPLDTLRIDVLIDGLDRLSAGRGPVLDAGAIDLIEAVTGFRPAVVAAPLASASAVRTSSRTADLEFFQALALQLDERSPHFKGRNGRLLRLALATNSFARAPVDAMQLQAAVNLHDVGMMFLRDSIWLKSEPMTEAERAELRLHPEFAAGLASRMGGWEDAATMIAQHHEMVNGAGYPLGLREEQIAPGAKILAIVDAFESVTLKHSRRGAGSSLLRAAAEINASDTQFSAEWIVYFNQAIRSMVEK